MNQRASQRRWAIAILLLLAAVGLFFFGPDEQVVLRYQTDWKNLVQENFPASILLYCGVCLLLIPMPIPMAAVMTLLAGLLFGPLLGTILFSCCATVAALIQMVACRYLFFDAVRRASLKRPRLEKWFAMIDRGIEREGVFYLILMRMTPVIPFFAINVGISFTRLPVRTFWWGTQLGMLPVTIIVVWFGSTVSEIRSSRDLLSPSMILSLSLLVLFPIVFRWIIRRHLKFAFVCDLYCTQRKSLRQLILR
jgi:uncharacterized membrane protein YdjX (TVP38/TMEM64 family)